MQLANIVCNYKLVRLQGSPTARAVDKPALVYNRTLYSPRCTYLYTTMRSSFWPALGRLARYVTPLIKINIYEQ